MQLPWSQVLLLLLLLLQLADITISVRLSRRWPSFNSHYNNFKPFKPKRARFAAPIHGFSNIFQNKGIDRWQNGRFPSMQRSAWSQYPAAPQRLQPIPLARSHYQSFPIPRPSPAPTPARRHQFVPASNIQHGKVPTHFMTDAELHGLVCIPASSLASALAGHQDRVTQHGDGSFTTHRTVLAGTDGTTSHSTRITSAGESTTVETRTNSSSGVQQHKQSVQNAGGGVVRTSTGSAFSGGRPGLPTHADVITSSSSEGGSSQSRASASGYDVSGKPLPARSISQSVSRGVSGRARVPPPLPLLPQLPQSYLPASSGTHPQHRGFQIESRTGGSDEASVPKDVDRSSPESSELTAEDTDEETQSETSSEEEEEGEEEDEVSESEDEQSEEDAEEPTQLEEELTTPGREASVATRNALASSKSSEDSSSPAKDMSQREDLDDGEESDDDDEEDHTDSSDDVAPEQDGEPTKFEAEGEGEEDDAGDEGGDQD